jgi:hypothetical protein
MQLNGHHIGCCNQPKYNIPRPLCLGKNRNGSRCRMSISRQSCPKELKKVVLPGYLEKKVVLPGYLEKSVLIGYCDKHRLENILSDKNKQAWTKYMSDCANIKADELGLLCNDRSIQNCTKLSKILGIPSDRKYHHFHPYYYRYEYTNMDENDNQEHTIQEHNIQDNSIQERESDNNETDNSNQEQECIKQESDIRKSLIVRSSTSYDINDDYSYDINNLSGVNIMEEFDINYPNDINYYDDFYNIDDMQIISYKRERESDYEDTPYYKKFKM